jgi:TPP-dependent trihydroxycyclohexane-1,2-dione (THcHDO) dehydratase
MVSLLPVAVLPADFAKPHDDPVLHAVEMGGRLTMMMFSMSAFIPN